MIIAAYCAVLDFALPDRLGTCPCNCLVTDPVFFCGYARYLLMTECVTNVTLVALLLAHMVRKWAYSTYTMHHDDWQIVKQHPEHSYNTLIIMIIIIMIMIVIVTTLSHWGQGKTDPPLHREFPCMQIVAFCVNCQWNILARVQIHYLNQRYN